MAIARQRPSTAKESSSCCRGRARAGEPDPAVAGLWCTARSCAAVATARARPLRGVGRTATCSSPRSSLAPVAAVAAGDVSGALPRPHHFEAAERVSSGRVTSFTDSSSSPTTSFTSRTLRPRCARCAGSVGPNRASTTPARANNSTGREGGHEPTIAAQRSARSAEARRPRGQISRGTHRRVLLQCRGVRIAARRARRAGLADGTGSRRKAPRPRRARRRRGRLRLRGLSRADRPPRRGRWRSTRSAKRSQRNLRQLLVEREVGPQASRSAMFGRRATQTTSVPRVIQELGQSGRERVDVAGRHDAAGRSETTLRDPRRREPGTPPSACRSAPLWSSSARYGAPRPSRRRARARSRLAWGSRAAARRRRGGSGQVGSPATSRRAPVTRRTASCVVELLVRADHAEREHRPAVLAPLRVAREDGMRMTRLRPRDSEPASASRPPAAGRRSARSRRRSGARGPTSPVRRGRRSCAVKTAGHGDEAAARRAPARALHAGRRQGAREARDPTCSSAFTGRRSRDRRKSREESG